MSYTQLLYHIVISTRKRKPSINIENERELYGYMFEFMKIRGVTLLKIGGMPDHIHILAAIPAALSLADFMRDIKSNTSRWLKGNSKFPTFDGWGREYSAFSCSFRNRNIIANYIHRQKQHHHAVNFADEYRNLLTNNGISFDERFLLTD